MAEDPVFAAEGAPLQKDSETGARYARQVVLPEVGPEGQERLGAARVLVVGVGGLGCPASLYLAASGIGHLTLVDPDRVEVSNLHRQVLYGPADVGRPKVEAAASALQRIAPAISIDVRHEGLDEHNARTLVAGHGIVVDGTDRLHTRYVIDDACRGAGIPWVHGAVRRHEGQVATFGPSAPWYRDLWPRAAGEPPSCAEEGVLPPVPGVIGTMQAQETLLWLLGVPRPRNLQVFHTFEGTSDTVHLDGRHAPLELPLSAAMRAKRVVDVRSPEEFAAGSLAVAENIPLPRLGDHVRRLEGHVLCVCATGTRSLRAAVMLRRRGVEASSLAGGLDAWRAEGGHVTRGPPPGKAA